MSNEGLLNITNAPERETHQRIQSSVKPKTYVERMKERDGQVKIESITE